MFVLLKTLLLPPAINFIFAAIGLLLLKMKPRLGKVLLSLSFISLYMFSLSPVSKWLVSGLEDYPAIVIVKDNIQEQAIVVLGGGRIENTPEYVHDTVNSWTLERVRYGALLSKQTQLPVLVSGGRLRDEQQSEADLMQYALQQDYGITTVIKEEQSRNTAENAIYSARLLKEQGIEKAYLVTHAWHMKRAVYAFEQTDIKVTPAPTIFSSSSVIHHPVLAWFSPSAGALSRSSFVVHEYIGLIWYRIRY